MGEKYAVLVKNMGLFFIAGFLPNVLAFFMIPLYTRCLTQSEYGAVDLLLNTVQLLAPVFTIQIQDAILRFAMDDTWDSGDVLRIGVCITMIGFGILCIACLTPCLLWLFGIPFWGGDAFDGLYVFFFIISYLAGTMLNIFSFYCRGINQVKTLTEGSLLNMALFVGFNLLLLWKWKGGMYGYLTANFISTAGNVLYIFFRQKLYARMRRRQLTQAAKRAETELAKEMTRFSVPLIFSTLSWWINNASDKYILNFFHGVSIVGVYAVAYKIPTILKVFGDIASMAFSISAIKEFDTEDADGFIGNSYSMISLFVVLCCSGLILGNQIIARILFAREFYRAWHFVPPLLFSVLMNQLSMSCENILVAAKQTKAISFAAVTGAAINTAANFLLIPYFGAYGAAVATAIGFTSFWAFRYWKLKKTVRMQNDLKRECASYVLLILQCATAYWGARFWYVQALVFVWILILYKEKLSRLFQAIKKYEKKI